MMVDVMDDWMVDESVDVKADYLVVLLAVAMVA